MFLFRCYNSFINKIIFDILHRPKSKTRKLHPPTPHLLLVHRKHTPAQQMYQQHTAGLCTINRHI